MQHKAHLQNDSKGKERLGGYQDHGCGKDVTEDFSNFILVTDVVSH